jgi:hypothetical protein
LGGFKYSGFGREYGQYGIEAFLETRAMHRRNLLHAHHHTVDGEKRSLMIAALR